MAKAVRVNNPLPARNNLGKRYPRWHSRHPSNGVLVPAVVAPTIGKGR